MIDLDAIRVAYDDCVARNNVSLPFVGDLLAEVERLREALSFLLDDMPTSYLDAMDEYDRDRLFDLLRRPTSPMTFTAEAFEDVL